MNYHVFCLNESSTEDDLKITYCKLALRSHPDKNKHPQASANFCMINETNQGLEYVLRHNAAMRRTQEIEEDLQYQEEYWREDKRIRTAQEESEEQKKQAEMDACMNNFFSFCRSTSC